jgi:hypothetical protein
MHPRPVPPALIGEAMRKAAVCWLSVGGAPAYPVWCAWAEGALLVVSGPGEQPAPGLVEAGPAGGLAEAGSAGAASADAASVDVTARGDHGGAIVTWRADVERLRPDTPEWDALVPGLAARRLNSAPTAELVERWARSNVVVRLTPRTAE